MRGGYAWGVGAGKNWDCDSLLFGCPRDVSCATSETERGLTAGEATGFDRRVGVICAEGVQVGCRPDEGGTDGRRLFQYCEMCVLETEFFIRKAVGWALRDYSYTVPRLVMEFLKENRERLSGQSYREGARALRRLGYTFGLQ